MDLPVGTTSKQLELLINSLLANQESVRVPSHAFLDNKYVLFLPIKFYRLLQASISSTSVREIEIICFTTLSSLIFLLSHVTQLPYAFYVNNVEVISSVNETLIELAEAGTFDLLLRLLYLLFKLYLYS